MNMKSSLFMFAENEPKDPETVVYKFEIPETEQTELEDF